MKVGIDIKQNLIVQKSFWEGTLRKFILISIIFITGCSGTSTQIKEALHPAEGLGNSITCQGDCKTEWERAQLWIVRHSKYKIQTSTDVLIQTYNPTGSVPNYGFTVIKEPTGDSSYSIQIAMTCGNMFGCSPKPEDLRKAFLYYVKTGVDLLANIKG